MAKGRRRIITDEYAECGKCRKFLPHNAFSKASNQPCGLCNSCRECRSAQRKADYSKRYDVRVATCEVCDNTFDPLIAMTGAERRGGGAHRKYCSLACRRAAGRSMVHGVTAAEYLSIVSQPCAVCGSTPSYYDHDHETGKVRGALCSKHNAGLGILGDSVESVVKTLIYLLKDHDVDCGCGGREVLLSSLTGYLDHGRSGACMGGTERTSEPRV